MMPQRHLAVVVEAERAPAGDVEPGVTPASRSMAVALTSSVPPTMATRSPSSGRSAAQVGQQVGAGDPAWAAARPVSRPTATIGRAVGQPDGGAGVGPAEALVLRQLDDVVDVGRDDVRDAVEVGQRDEVVDRHAEVDPGEILRRRAGPSRAAEARDRHRS